MNIKNSISALIADAYYEGSLNNMNMHQLANVLEDIRQEISNESDPFKILKRIDIRKGAETDLYILEIISSLYNAYEKLFTEFELLRIHKIFKKDRDRGFKLWFDTYIKSMVNWRCTIATRLAEEQFSFPDYTGKLVETIREQTWLTLRDRWYECYDLFQMLSESDLVRNKDKVHFLVSLGEIELYISVDLKKARHYFSKAQSLVGSKPRVLLGWGEYHLQNNEIEKAKELFRKVIERDPMMQEGFYKLADCYVREARYEVAEKWYLEGIRKAGDSYYKYLEIFQQQDFYNSHRESSNQIFDQAIISAAPDDKYYITLRIADIFIKNKEFATALTWFDKAKKLYPDRIGVYVALGYAYLEENVNDYSRALRNFSRVIQLDKKAFDGYWGKAWVYELQENWTTAVQWYRKSIPFRKRWTVIIRKKIGDLLSKAGKLAEAEKEYFLGLRQDPKEERLIYSIEDLAYNFSTKSDTIKKAISIYQRIGKIAGEDYSASMFNRIGNVYYYHYQYQKAADQYQKACDIDNTIPVYFANLGLANLELKKYDLAKTFYLKALNLDPDNDAYLNYLGVIFYRLEKYKESVKWYQKAIQQNKGKSLYFQNLGLSYEKLDRISEAKKMYQKAAKLDPEDAINWNNLGIIHYIEKNYNKAVKQYKKAIELDPKKHLYHANMGLAYGFMDRWDDTVEAYKVAAKLDPDNDSYWRSLGIGYKRLKKYALAKESYFKALEINPNEQNDWNDLGLIYYDEGNDIEAIKYYQKAINIQPDNDIFYANLGLSLGFLNRWNESLQAYMKASELNPEYPDYYNRIGSCFFRLIDYNQAITFFQKAVELENQNPGYWNSLADAYRLSYIFEKAEEAYQKAIQLAPEEGTYLNNLAVNYHMQGLYVNAIEYYHAAIEKDPDNPLFYVNLALACFYSGNWEGMIEAFETSIQLDNKPYKYNKELEEVYHSITDETSREAFMEKFKDHFQDN